MWTKHPLNHPLQTYSETRKAALQQADATSETSVNREVNQAMKAEPVKALGGATVTEILRPKIIPTVALLHLSNSRWQCSGSK